MKKRAVKLEEMQICLQNASSLSSNDSPNDQSDKSTVSAPKKTTKRRARKTKEENSPSLFTEAELLEAEAPATDRVEQKDESKKSSKSKVALSANETTLNERRGRTRKTTKKSVKRTTNDAIGPEVEEGNRKTTVADACDSSCSNKGKKRAARAATEAGSSSNEDSAKTVKKPRKRAVKKAEDSQKVSVVESGTNGSTAASHVLTEQVREIESKIESCGLSDSEKQRRERYLENKRFGVLSTNTGYPGKLPFWEHGWLVVQGAREHNLKSIDAPFPLSAFTVVTGVSGSGKSSLVEDVLYRNLARCLNHSQLPAGACDAVVGVERIGKVIKVDQAPIGQTPTSNAATYTGLFDLIRQLFAQLPEAKMRGYSSRHFSFNVPGGRCEKCEGAGVLKVEMHFLADVLITCDACKGKRYDSETLQVKYRGKSIADVLETTCGEALKFFAHIPPIAQILQTLCDVGLDYLPLGQPATTLSGGEAQRIKLAAELSQIDSGRTLYLLDEPTTGLHFEDVRKLLLVLHRLVDLGNTVVVVEHNLDVIKSADWIVEIGPEAGMEGGRLVFAGTPEQLLEHAAKWQDQPDYQKDHLRSYTGEALIPVFKTANYEERPTLDAHEYWEKLKNSRVIKEEDVEEENSSSGAAEQPWEIDGRRWHTEFRTTRSGAPCKWEGRVLSAIVDRLEELSFLSETNWNNRSTVEICSDLKPTAWFMRASTCEEWLLRLKFRTAKNTFERGLLTRKLALRPLKEIEEIPLYGTLPRIKLDTVGAWQEVELKVYSFAEIDRPEFWNFLDLAVKRFAENVDRNRENEVDLTPWKTQGRDWHVSPVGISGSSNKPAWPVEMLVQILEKLEKVGLDVEGVWTNRLAVPFTVKGFHEPWGQVFTKNSDFVCVQLSFPKGKLEEKQIEGIGFEPEIERSTDGSKFDSVYLRFKSQEDFDLTSFEWLVKESYKSYKAALE